MRGSARTRPPDPEGRPMSGAMRRIGEYLGLLEDTGQYDDEYADYDESYDGHYSDEATTATAAKPTRREAREARDEGEALRRRTQDQGRRPARQASAVGEGLHRAPARPGRGMGASCRGDRRA